MTKTTLNYIFLIVVVIHINQRFDKTVDWQNCQCHLIDKSYTFNGVIPLTLTICNAARKMSAFFMMRMSMAPLGRIREYWSREEGLRPWSCPKTGLPFAMTFGANKNTQVHFYWLPIQNELHFSRRWPD